MLTPILQQLLISAAALLTVTGSLSVYESADRPLATLFAAAEDGQQDEGGDTLFQASEPIFETTLLVSTSSNIATFVDIPIFCALHNERGPPQV